MAASLANDGVNPLTGEAAMPAEFVQDVLSVMHSCGMYDYAGQWAYEVGIPAKSGVSGCVIAFLAIPGQIGIAIYSPRLDSYGNSVRGVMACRRISADFGLHAFCSRTGVNRSCVTNSMAFAFARSGFERQRNVRSSTGVAGRSASSKRKADCISAPRRDWSIAFAKSLPTRPTSLWIFDTFKAPTVLHCVCCKGSPAFQKIRIASSYSRMFWGTARSQISGPCLPARRNFHGLYKSSTDWTTL